MTLRNSMIEPSPVRLTMRLIGAGHDGDAFCGQKKQKIGLHY
jgi:hypothetical protein